MNDEKLTKSRRTHKHCIVALCLTEVLWCTIYIHNVYSIRLIIVLYAHCAIYIRSLIKKIAKHMMEEGVSVCLCVCLWCYLSCDAMRTMWLKINMSGSFFLWSYVFFTCKINEIRRSQQVMYIYTYHDGQSSRWQFFLWLITHQHMTYRDVWASILIRGMLRKLFMIPMIKQYI